MLFSPPAPSRTHVQPTAIYDGERARTAACRRIGARRRVVAPRFEEGPMPEQESDPRSEQLLTVAEVAAHIGANEQTVRQWIRQGELRAAKFGTRIGYRIKRADYDDFLRRRTLTTGIAWQLLQVKVVPDPKSNY
jgi:excisionase family DNA binding protein